MMRMSGNGSRRLSVLLALTLVFSLAVAPVSFAGVRPGKGDDAKVASAAVPTSRAARGDLSATGVSPAAYGEAYEDIMARWKTMGLADAAAKALDRDPHADDGLDTLVTLEDASALPYPWLTDSVDPFDDVDVYRVYLAAGEQITCLLECDIPLEASVYLYTPDAVGLFDSIMDGNSTAVNPYAWFDYTVPVGADGWYRIAVDRDAYGGPYYLGWTVNSRGDGNIGVGQQFPDDWFEGYVDDKDDADDVYEVNLTVGQTIEATLTPTAGTGAPSMGLFAPDATDVWASAAEVWSETHISYTVPPGEAGVYALDVWAYYEFGVEYEIEWSVSEVDVPGMSISSLPIGLTGDAVFYVDLMPGETLNVDPYDVSGGTVTARLFDRDALSVYTHPILASGTTDLYTVPVGEGGRYYVFLDASDPGVTYSVDVWGDPSVSRAAGLTRYETNVEISMADFADGADVVVVATGANFPDALSASALAGAYDAPILLTGSTSLPPVVADEIVRLGATRCFIVGGTGAVNDDVAAAIDALPGMQTPVRIAGVDRYETATNVAEQVYTRQGFRFYGIALLTRGDDYADALAFSPLAWSGALPILLTRPAELPASTAGFLERGEVGGVAIGGGTGAVSQSVEGIVYDILLNHGVLLQDPPVIRFEGLDRYQTALMIAAFSSMTPWASGDFLGLATGADFADALGGGAGCGKMGGVMMLTKPTDLEQYGEILVGAWAGWTRTYQVFGGSGAVSDSVIAEVESIVYTP